jgi:hypothetical protein
MFTALSYIGAHWFLILSVVAGTAGLAAFAWFTKNWKAALAAVVLVMAGLFYQSADLGGYKRALDEQKAAEIQTLQTRLLTVSMLNANDAKRAVADQFVLTQLEKLASETPPNLGPCLDAAAAHRVWAVRSLNAGSAPVPARRISNVFQRALKRP